MFRIRAWIRILTKKIRIRIGKTVGISLDPSRSGSETPDHSPTQKKCVMYSVLRRWSRSEPVLFSRSRSRCEDVKAKIFLNYFLAYFYIKRCQSRWKKVHWARASQKMTGSATLVIIKFIQRFYRNPLNFVFVFRVCRKEGCGLLVEDVRNLIMFKTFFPIL